MWGKSVFVDKIGQLHEMLVLPAETEWIEFKEAKRKDIDNLLISKVSDALAPNQKKQFITNLLQEMRRENLITSIGRSTGAKWFLYDDE